MVSRASPHPSPSSGRHLCFFSPTSPWKPFRDHPSRLHNVVPCVSKLELLRCHYFALGKETSCYKTSPVECKLKSGLTTVPSAHRVVPGA